MSNIDNVIGPDNLDGNGNIHSKPKKGTTQSKLDSLKYLLDEDNIKFDVNDHLPKPGDFPVSQNIKLIDYDAEDKKSLEEATGVINSIIWNFIKSDNLLKSDKIEKIKDSQIKTLAELDDLVKGSKANKRMLQESIDAGDMAPETFKLVKEFSTEMRANIEARIKHIEKCEQYWKNYALSYGLENKEEEIIRKSEVKEDEGPKKIIMDISSLNSLIEEKMKEEAQKMENNKAQAQTIKDATAASELGDDSLLNDKSTKKIKKGK